MPLLFRELAQFQLVTLPGTCWHLCGNTYPYGLNKFIQLPWSREKECHFRLRYGRDRFKYQRNIVYLVLIIYTGLKSEMVEEDMGIKQRLLMLFRGNNTGGIFTRKV